MARARQAQHLLQRLASAGTRGAITGNRLSALSQLECRSALDAFGTAPSAIHAFPAAPTSASAENLTPRKQQHLQVLSSKWAQQLTSSVGGQFALPSMAFVAAATNRVPAACICLNSSARRLDLRPQPISPCLSTLLATVPRRSLSTSPSASSSQPTEQQQQPQQQQPDPVYNLPNAVSAARLVSGPVIGFWLLQGQYEVATIALAISGASDWLDGYLARRMGATSVFGSYLDPLADKVLIACVAGALLANGSMPLWLGCVVVGRDVALVGGALAFRLQSFGWRWPGREAFFRTADAAASGSPAGSVDAGGGAGEAGAGGSCVSYMRPLMISKANTVLQLVLFGGYLTRGMYGWPEGDPVVALELATAATTVASMVAYGRMAMQGRLFK